MKNYQEIERDGILNTVSVLLEFENKGYICDWEINRIHNTWHAWYPYKNDSHLIGGRLIDTDEETIILELERVMTEHEEWLNS